MKMFLLFLLAAFLLPLQVSAFQGTIPDGTVVGRAIGAGTGLEQPITIQSLLNSGSITLQPPVLSAIPARGPISVYNPLFAGAAVAGQDGACQFWVANALTATPSIGDAAPCSFVIDDQGPRAGHNLWGSDFLVSQTNPTADAVVHGIEVEFSAGISSQTDPMLDTPTHSKIGVDVVAQPFAASGAHPSTYFRGYSPDNTGAYTPWAGLTLSRVHDVGIWLDDLGDSNLFTFAKSSIYDNTMSGSIISVGKAHQEFLDLSNATGGFSSAFIKGFNSGATNLIIRNNANATVQWGLNSGATATENASVDYYDQGTLKWQLQKNNANGFGLIDLVNNISAWFVDPVAQIFTVNEVNGISAPKYSAGATPGVSCAAGTVNLTTFVVTNGIVTHC